MGGVDTEVTWRCRQGRRDRRRFVVSSDRPLYEGGKCQRGSDAIKGGHTSLCTTEKIARLSDANCRVTGRLRNHREPLDLGGRIGGLTEHRAGGKFVRGARWNIRIFIQFCGGLDFGFVGFIHGLCAGGKF